MLTKAQPAIRTLFITCLQLKCNDVPDGWRAELIIRILRILSDSGSELAEFLRRDKQSPPTMTLPAGGKVPLR